MTKPNRLKNGAVVCWLLLFLSCSPGVAAQIADTAIVPKTLADTVLRIRNLNPYITLHVDSLLYYKLEINKAPDRYYWFLKNSPVGLKINKDNGLLTFQAEKKYFLSGKLKYDYEYKVAISVQNLSDPTDRVDTFFTLLFFNTEIIASKLKPSVTEDLFVDEGDTLSFKIQCEQGSFPIEEITYISNYPVKSVTPVKNCDDDFSWIVPFDFVKDSEKEKTKKLQLHFIGVTRFNARDTSRINIYVRDNINYPMQVAAYEVLQTSIDNYILQLKSSFRIVDKKIRKTKRSRTSFDLAAATAGLSGTVLASVNNPDLQTVGKIMPSVGVALVPVKEAVSPASTYEQNSATLIRSSIKRLEYLLLENRLVGERDPEILNKSRKLKEELKQTQVQLIDIPIADEKIDEKELNEYFNSEEVNKKYRAKKRN
jgi:hypothetical protein